MVYRQQSPSLFQALLHGMPGKPKGYCFRRLVGVKRKACCAHALHLVLSLK